MSIDGHQASKKLGPLQMLAMRVHNPKTQLRNIQVNMTASLPILSRTTRVNLKFESSTSSSFLRSCSILKRAASCSALGTTPSAHVAQVFSSALRSLFRSDRRASSALSSSAFGTTAGSSSSLVSSNGLFLSKLASCLFLARALHCLVFLLQAEPDVDA